LLWQFVAFSEFWLLMVVLLLRWCLGVMFAMVIVVLLQFFCLYQRLMTVSIELDVLAGWSFAHICVECV
jgi:hypothetical protein